MIKIQIIIVSLFLGYLCIRHQSDQAVHEAGRQRHEATQQRLNGEHEAWMRRMHSKQEERAQKRHTEREASEERLRLVEQLRALDGTKSQVLADELDLN